MSFDMAPAAGAPSLETAAAVLRDLGYAESYLPTVRAAVNKARKVFDRPLSRIPADREAIEDFFARSSGYAALGFKAERQARDWLSTIVGVCDRVERHRLTGDGRAVRFADDWPRVTDFVKNDAPKLGVVSWRAASPFDTFVSVAREDGVTPPRADGAWVARALERLGYERRKSFLRGLAIFNALVASVVAHDALPGLLPATPAAPPPTRAARGAYVGFLPAEIPETIRADFAVWLDRKRNGEFEDRLSDNDDQPTFTDSSAKAYGYAVGWLWRSLVAAERIDRAGSVDLADLLTYRNIFDAARLFQEMRADPISGLKSDAGTLHCYVSKTTQIAIEHCAVSAADRDKMRKLRRNRLVRTKSVAKMASERMSWVRALADDDRLQRRLLDLPELLMRMSREVLNRWDKTGPVERMRGLKLGVAAAQAAILFYGKPIRAANLRCLRIWCDAPTLALPDGRGAARLNIPGEETKNGRPIEGDLDPEARPILRWYLESVRTRLIEAHPCRVNYADGPWLFCSPRADRPMEHSVFAAAYADATQAAGIDMTFHLARHATVFFLLDEDPNAWSEAAEILDIDEMTVRKHYAFICGRKARQAARARLRRARARRLRGGS
jgi:hypothetical protein